VSALVLADTSPVADDEAGRNRRTTLADRLLVEGMAGYAAEVLDQMITPYHVVEQPAVAAHVRRMMLGTDPKGAAAALRGRAQRPDYQDSLSRVQVPALVLVGDEDAFTPLDQAELIRNLIPGSELVVIRRAGHLPGLEQPETFNTALLAFLDRMRER
jgi:pimeloyl-ACP methyl ester carboxylesterase